MDSITAFGVIVSAIAGVFLTLALGAVGYIIAAYNEEKRWIRQQRNMIYRAITKNHLALTKASNEVISNGNIVRDFPSQDPTVSNKELYSRHKDRYDASLDFANDLADKVRESRYELVLMGTPKVKRYFNEYLGESTAWLVLGRSGNDNKSAAAKRDKAWGDFIDQAQRDLGLKHWWNRRP